MIDAHEIINRYGADILASKGMKSEQHFMQHGDISCYRHSMRVALASVKLAHTLHVKADTRAMVRAALLHDYFLYDWHEPGHSGHGFTHAKRAMTLASRDFSLSPREKNIILRHMFPLNITPPRHREGWLVCMADKWCALQETISLRFPRLKLKD